MRKTIILLLVLSSAVTSGIFGQKSEQSVSLGLGVGPSEGSLSAAYAHQWKLGSNQRFLLGLGGRFTGYLSKNKYYLTAPARITSGQTGPQVFFSETISDNIDSVLFETTQVNALNISFNTGYAVSSKLFIGFNIDLVGLSFGANQQGRFFEGNSGQLTSGRPTVLNLLLVSDNDIGSLNSEIFGHYRIKDNWAIRAGLQFLFTEFTTETEVQQIPEPNDRFRNKSLMFAAGVSYFLSN